MMDRYLTNQYRETKVKFNKFSSRLQNSQKRGEFQTYSQGKQNYLLNRIRKLWQKLRILEARLKITTTGVSLALILMVSNLNAQEQFVLAPGKNPMPPPTIYGFEPSLVDIDMDGDLDLVASSLYEKNNLFENTGTPTAPVFVRVSDASNPLNSIANGEDFEVWEIIAAKDLDGDGDVDLLANEGTFLRNTGSNNDIQYTMESNGIGMFGGVKNLGDVDGDGDFDLLAIAYSDTIINVFENTGGPNAHDFADTALSYPVSNWNDEIRDVDRLYPADLDNDGDLDLVIGVDMGDYYSENRGYETLHVIENTGTAGAPVFVLKEEVDNPYRDMRTDEVSLNDLDGDGDFDVLFFDYYLGGGMQYFELDNNSLTENKDLVPEFYDGIILPFSYILAPQFVDYDGDGDLDIIAFAYGSENFLKYFEYQDSEAQLKFMPIDNKSFEFIDPDKEIQLPFFVDMDGDGDTDLIRLSYDYDSEFIDYIYMENSGTAAVPVYSEQAVPALTGRENILIPAFADIDGDGDMDIFAFGYTSSSGEYSYDSGMHYFESTGDDPTEFTERMGDDNPLAILTEDNFPEVEEYLRPVFADIDQDGDLDVVFRGIYGLYYLENQGSPTNPSFVDRSETGPFSSLELGYYSIPTLADMDGDGDLDLLAHEWYGLITSYYENMGPTGNPDFKKADIHSMEIYPNPVSDVMNVKLDQSEAGSLDYEIISLESRQIQHGSTGGHTNANQFSIDTGHLQSGQYVLKVRSGESIYISKFVKL